jgi:ribosomal protein S18 acetylase RimI-like enzyme
MGFEYVEENLRESFRVLAAGRARGDVVELPGVSIASLGVTFQMFNAAFLSAPVESQHELEERLHTARNYFARRGLAWSFWVCESWLSQSVRRRLARTFDEIGLRVASEMPGMEADRIAPVKRPLPALEILPVQDPRTLDHFRIIGSTCFHVPSKWFAEVFDVDFESRKGFPCWVGYHDGAPVATAASVRFHGALGIYNVATLPDLRERGFGEAITRFAIAQHPAARVILQSTVQGLPLYERLGFRAVTRFVVFNSR